MGTFSGLEQIPSSKEDGDRYLSGLGKSKKSPSERIRELAFGFIGINEEFLEDLMVVLLEANIGIKTAQKIANKVESRAIDQKPKNFDEISECLIEVMHELYASVEDEDFYENEDGPTVTLMVDVSGSGKMATTAKLTKLFQSEGSSIVLATAGTLHAGATDQLAEQADRLGMTCIKRREGGDPSAALMDACHYVKKHSTNCLIGDTIGRLQNKANLMQKPSKMCRAIEREVLGAPHEAWLVLDATTRQNGISQAQIFLEITKVGGITLTEMDGTAKGDIVIAIRDLLGLPVKCIGPGEKEDDLRPFDVDSYLYGLCEDILQHD